MTALLFLSWMIAGACVWGIFLIGVHHLVLIGERRKALKRAAWKRRLHLATRSAL